ncbi:proteasome assembly chaperone family protein [Methanococcus vannielii]|nr:proteasome assembly chaperone family protein [Methanococcus vannielii]
MEFVSKKEINFKEPLVVVGFPGIGLVGSIASYHLLKNLKLEYLGHFEDPKIPGIMIVEEGIAYPPVRVYGRDDLLVFFSDVMIPPELVHEMSKNTVDFLENLNPKMVITLEGFASMNPENVYWVSSSKDVLKPLLSETVGALELGMLGGISGILMKKCNDKNINSACLITETIGLRPDPRGASKIIEILNNYYSINADIGELIKEAENIEEKMKNLAKEHAKMMSKPKTENPMYM